MGKPQFFEIKDEAVIGKVLDIAHRHKPLVTVWSKNQSIRFETKVNSYLPNFKRLGLQFPVTMNEVELLEALKQQGSDLMASFQIETVNFFLKTQYLDMPNPHTIQVQIPKQIFKMQRRSHLRIPFTRSTAPALTIVDPRKEHEPGGVIKPSDLLHFRIIDLSVGGLAVAARTEDKDLFNMGSKIFDMKFKLKGHEITTNGVIMHAFETLSDQKKPMLQVGIRFVNLQANLERIIAQFALDESRRLFTLLC